MAKHPASTKPGRGQGTGPGVADQAIAEYAKQLIAVAPTLGDHGLTEEQFWRSGLFDAALDLVWAEMTKGKP